MPILLKKIDGSIISLFGNDDSDFVGKVSHIKSVVGEIGLEDYILIEGFEALIQDFSNVIEAEFCETITITFGPNACPTYEDLTVSY